MRRFTAIGLALLMIFQQAIGSGVELAWQKLLEHIAPKVWRYGMSSEWWGIDPWALLFGFLALLVWMWPSIVRKIRERGMIHVEYTSDEAACFLNPVSTGCTFNVFKHDFDDEGCIGQTIGLYFSREREADWFKVEFEDGSHPVYEVPFISKYGAMIHVAGNVDGKRLIISEHQLKS